MHEIVPIVPFDLNQIPEGEVHDSGRRTRRTVLRFDRPEVRGEGPAAERVEFCAALLLYMEEWCALEGGHASVLVSSLEDEGLTEKLEGLGKIPANTREDRGVALRKAAAFHVSQFHDQVLEIFESIALKSDDEFLVIQSERIGRVEFHGREAMAHLEVFIHHSLSSRFGQPVPISRLHEGIDEQVALLPRLYDQSDSFLTLVMMRIHIGGSLCERKIGVGCIKIAPEPGLIEIRRHSVEVLERICDPPENKVRVCTNAKG